VITEKIRDDYVEKLKNDVKASFGEEMRAKMWTSDFNKHCQCLDAFSACMATQPDEFEESMDLIFKWASLTMLNSSNMKFIVNFIDFCTNVVSFLTERDYVFAEFEV
jgi:hypothetical protein